MNLSPDTQATLLLCSRLGQNDDSSADVLSVRQYGELARWLKNQDLRPADLIEDKGRDALTRMEASGVDRDRVRRLLSRGTALGIAVERWQRQGLWVLSRSDPEYPSSYKSYLGIEAPPVIYGVGNISLLSRKGLAIVGSRDADEEDLQFAAAVARACASQKVAVISGAARGVDMAAMTAAYDEGGIAIGVLPDGLAKAAVSPRFREGLLNDRLVLISMAEPEARWFVHTAMQRNKLIYGLSAAALVVSSGEDEGGTWAGATEALRSGRIRVYVKVSGTVSGGNKKLISKGALPFPADASQDVGALLGPVVRSGDLFATNLDADISADTSSPPVEQPAAQQEPPLEDAGVSVRLAEAEEPRAGKPDSADEHPVVAGPSRQAYYLVLPEVLRLLEEPRQADWLATEMDVEKKQMAAWLKRAQDEGLVRKLSKPIRYVAVSTHKSLFFEEKP